MFKTIRKSLIALALAVAVFAATVIVPVTSESASHGQPVAFFLENLIEGT